MSPSLPPCSETQLRAEGLVIRPWRPSDAAAISSAYQADDEIPRRTGFPYGLTVAQAAAYISERRAAWDSGGKAAFGIFDEDRQLLGSISLLRIEWDRRVAQVGYWLARDARGRGVLSRSMAQMVVWAAELGLDSLGAAVEVTNAASRRVLERSGFTCEGLVRANSELHGAWIDEYVYVRHIAQRP